MNRRTLVAHLFAMAGLAAAAAPAAAADWVVGADIGNRFGDFYACRLIETLGLQARGGVVRVSIVHCNALEEIDRLVAHLDDIVP
ncbi:MAG: hypothetical protein ACRYGA_09160 [Janthinobacterium lividum]